MPLWPVVGMMLANDDRLGVEAEEEKVADGGDLMRRGPAEFIRESRLEIVSSLGRPGPTEGREGHSC